MSEAPASEGMVEAEDKRPAQAAGLMDAAAMEAPAPAETDPSETLINHRNEEPATIPEGVPDKFVKDNVVDIRSLAKSYTELEAKFRAGKHKAPEDGYDLAVAKDAGIPDDDPVLKVYADWAKEAGISQEHFNELAGKVIANGAAAVETETFNQQAEMDSLGSNAQAIIDDQVSWAQKLVKTGTWGADDFEEFKVWGGTANGIRALQKLRRFMGDTSKIPVNINPSADALPSEAECYQMVKDPRYQSDPTYRAKVEKTFSQVFGTQPDERTIM